MAFVFQFFADADDVDTWMLDTLRLVSSEDVGRDEASVQSLLKKHKVGTTGLDQSILCVNVNISMCPLKAGCLPICKRANSLLHRNPIRKQF